ALQWPGRLPLTIDTGNNMNSVTPRPPIVLCFAGSDSFSAAGAQADLKTIASHGCHATQVITAITAQSPADCRTIFPSPAIQILEQVAALKKGPKPAAIKIGMIGSAEALAMVRSAVMDLTVPVILDPILRTS